jgi:hypothetical protein
MVTRDRGLAACAPPACTKRWVALAACGLLLAGCAASPSRPPLSGAERASIRADLLDSRWALVREQYPEAIRPAITVGPTIPDHGWPETVVRCLHGLGFVAVPSGGGVEYRSGGGKPQLEFAVARYSCEAAHPAESAVAAHLRSGQSAALYGYYLNVVRPCLLLAGAPSPVSPDRSAVVHLAGLAGWNPYQVIWTSGISDTALGYLEQRCPPVPVWLNLGN